VEERVNQVVKHVGALQNQVSKVLIISFQKYNRPYQKYKNGDCCKFYDKINFTLNNVWSKELRVSDFQFAHELNFLSNFLNFVEVPDVVCSDRNMEKSSECHTNFFRNYLIPERFKIQSTSRFGKAILNQEAGHTEHNDSKTLTKSEF
jgi:hypothetical protein